MKNKLYITLGGRGGVGKTTGILGLTDYIHSTGEPFVAIDCDTENEGKAAAFSNYVPSCTKLNLRTVSDCDRLLNLAAENAITIADLPANAGGDILPWMDVALVPEVLDALDLEVIGIGVVTNESGAFASVVQWVARLQDRMKYVLVLNHRFAARVPQSREEAFPEVFKTETGKAFIDGVNPSLVEIPGLYAGSGMLWANSAKLPSEFASGTAPILDRTRVRAWAKAIHAQWDAALKDLHTGAEEVL